MILRQLKQPGPTRETYVMQKQLCFLQAVGHLTTQARDKPEKKTQSSESELFRAFNDTNSHRFATTDLELSLLLPAASVTLRCTATAAAVRQLRGCIS